MTLYLRYFHLQEAPFSIAPNPRYLYMSPRHQEALAHLLYGVGEGGGFVALTGEVGTGKTTLCRCLLDQLPSDVDLALILNPRLNSVELLGSLCDELGIPYPPHCSSLKILTDLLNSHLLQIHARGRRTVALIDEAQNLNFEVLEQVRLLTNLETNQNKLLQIILVGQPELQRLLAREDLRQLAQRITARYHLMPLSPSETTAYIEHRITVSGGSSPLFTAGAMRKIHRLSEGIPRLINIICDRALLGAYTTGKEKVTGDIVKKAAKEVLPQRLPDRRSLTGAAIIAVLLTAGAGWHYFGSWPMTAGTPPLASQAPPTAAPVIAKTQPAVQQDLPPKTQQSTTDAEDKAPAQDKAPFASLLQDQTLTENRAFSRLLARWGIKQALPRGQECEIALQNGLRCLIQQGSWQQMRRFNRPAVLEFILENGQKRYATLMALDHEQLTLDVAGESLRFSLLEVLPFWRGRYTLLWKPPDQQTMLLGPGQRASAVGWLRRQLGGSEDSAAPDHGTFYDDQLKARVIAFQGSHGLIQDGIVGPKTFIQLNNALNDPTIPTLEPRRD